MRALITGANRGIGRALADLLTAEGMDVLGTARAADGCLPLDLRDPAAIAALPARIGTAPLDVLVCNAGVYLEKGRTGPAAHAPALWAESFAVNVTGVFLCVEALKPHLLRAKQPRIAIIASQMGSSTRASGGSYIYRASKAAVINLGRNLAADLKTDGIAVGIYHPGWVRTDMGGTSAAISVEESARGLADRIAALDLAQSGIFETWRGDPHPF